MLRVRWLRGVVSCTRLQTVRVAYAKQAIVGSAGVTSSGNKVQKRRLSALQHQVCCGGHHTQSVLSLIWRL